MTRWDESGVITQALLDSCIVFVRSRLRLRAEAKALTRPPTPSTVHTYHTVPFSFVAVGSLLGLLTLMSCLFVMILSVAISPRDVTVEDGAAASFFLSLESCGALPWTAHRLLLRVIFPKA